LTTLKITGNGQIHPPEYVSVVNISYYGEL
jgi:hypothetical protein